MQNNDNKGKTIYEQEDEKAIRCATEQVATDLADLEVIEANVSSRTDPLVHAHVRLQRPHWYVHVTMHHRSEGAEIHVLYRVWYAEGAWKATHVGRILPKRERCHMSHPPGVLKPFPISHERFIRREKSGNCPLGIVNLSGGTKIIDELWMGKEIGEQQEIQEV